MDHNIWLLADTLLAVIGLVVLIAWLKLNAFVALMLVSLVAGLAAKMSPVAVISAFEKGVGDVLGSIALVIGLLLARSITRINSFVQLLEISRFP